jgi:hypothetical protein
MDASRTGGSASPLAAAPALAPGCDGAHPIRISGELYGYPDRRALGALIGIDAHADAVQVDRHGRLTKAPQPARLRPSGPCCPSPD